MTIDIVPHFAFYALPDLFAIGKGENTSSPAASLSHATLLQPGRQVSLSVAEGEVLLLSAPTAPDPLCCSMAGMNRTLDQFFKLQALMISPSSLW